MKCEISLSAARERIPPFSRKADTMDGARIHGTSGGSRREFLKTAAATGGAAALAAGESTWAAPPVSATGLPLVTLGKTGQQAPALGMGTSWVLQPSFVQAALHAGVRYIDCSES